MRTKEEIEKIEQEIEEAIKNGECKRVGTEVIESLKDFEIDEESFIFNDQLLETYYYYLEQLKTIPSDMNIAFLNLLKDADIIDNQSVENENSFLVALYSRMQSEHAIDELLKRNDIDKEALIKVHDLIIKNATESHDKIRGFRTTNTKAVGSVENGKRYIQYIPVDYKDIDNIADKIVEYYNNSKENKDLIFIKPILIHGLIATYQMFDDGNTRLARSIQHTKIYHMTHEYTDYKTDLPTIYSSKQYYPFRKEYRDLITNLVLNHNNEAWNKWLVFNMKRIEDALFHNTYMVQEMYHDQFVKYKRIVKNIENDIKNIKN